MATRYSSTFVDEYSDEEPETDNSKSTFGFDKKTERTDLVLSVEGNKLHVSRMLLEEISPKFGDLFRDKLLAGEPNEVKIEGKACKDFVEFLNCIYPRIMSNVTSKNVYQVFPLACEFNVVSLKKRCGTVLRKMMSGMKDGDELVVRCYIDAHRSGLFKFKDESLRAIANLRLEKIETADKSLPFDANTKCKIYEAMMPALRSEVSRNRFVSVGSIDQDYIDISKFVDAKYKQIEFECKVKEKNPKEDDYLERELWDIKIRIEVKQKSESKPVKVGVSLDHQSKLSRCLLAVKLIIKNRKSEERNVCYHKCKTIPTHESANPWKLIQKFEMDEIKHHGFTKKGTYSLICHILMNKPEYSST